MIKWIRSLFQRKEPPFNINHPDMQGRYEFAFEAGPLFRKTKYYRAVKDYMLPVGRYKFIDARLYAAELKMNLKTLGDYMDVLEKHLDGSKGVVTLSKAFEVIWAIRSRINLGFEPETIKNLAAVVYFDETEILNDFDEEYGNKKIKFWDQYDCLSFFLTMPMSELLNLTDTSEESLREYIAKASEIIKDLSYVLPTQSLDNT
jgi:hypothetical protein